MKFLLVVLASFSIFQAVGSSPNGIDDWTREAEAAYTNGDFHQAAQFYQQVIDAGVQSSQIYFNLGNTYYQLHDLGRALVNYRRVEQFIPRDEDLHLNMARIRAQRVDAQIGYVAIGDQIAELVAGWGSKPEIELTLLILWWICCGCSVVYILLHRLRKWIRWGVLTSCALLIFVGAPEGVRLIVENSHQSAVIVVDSASVLTGSDAKYMEIFVLHSAAEVRIVERSNGWVKIQLPDLQEGWVKVETLEVI